MLSNFFLIFIVCICIVTYLGSWILCRTDSIKLRKHRRIWNIVILVTFLVTVVLGLTHTVQVNYKIKIPLIDQIISWFVNFGIAMAIIGFFHILRHFSYSMDLLYLKKERIDKSIINTIGQSPIILTARQTGVAILLLGFVTIISQTIVLREFLAIFNGNELIIGLFLFNWMVITGLGALLGMKPLKMVTYHSSLIRFFLILILIPPLQVLVLNILKNVVFIQGIMVGALQLFFIIFVILIPFCLSSGFIFSRLAVMFSGINGKSRIPKAYAIETIGSLAGGLLLSFILTWLFDPFQSLFIMLFISMLVLLAFYHRHLRKFLIIVCVSIPFLLLIFSFIVDTNIWLRSFQYPNQTVIFAKNTPYNDLVVTQQADQLSFFSDSKLIFSTQNIVFNEEAVHYTLVQTTDPKNILLVSGGISGITNEINKYRVSKIDYLENDSWIFKLGKKYTQSLKDTDINTIVADARQYVNNYVGSTYDAVIMVYPNPVSAQINRLYTIEFFRNLKKIITKNGVYGLSISSSYNYQGEAERNINAILFKTLKTAFKNVIIIPGEKFYYIASDSLLTTEIAKKIELTGISTSYVNQYYIDDELIKNRSETILNDIQTVNASINKDFQPSLYYAGIDNWLQFFAGNKRILTFIFSLFLIILLAYNSNNIYNISILLGGITISMSEFAILILFQVVFGYVYQAIGVLFGLFMLGLALGSCYYQSKTKKKYSRLSINQIVLGVASILLILLIMYASKSSIQLWLLQGIIATSILIISILSGSLFAIVISNRPDPVNKTIASTYGYDLIGSSIGILLASMYFIPLFGIVKTIVGIGILNIAFGIYIFYFNE